MAEIPDFTISIWTFANEFSLGPVRELGQFGNVPGNTILLETAFDLLIGNHVTEDNSPGNRIPNDD